ncbi:MAG: T9SS type A sorting domain-containing protein [candidate division KSB1 bacterium]|nr:T9SS type A sorting domain-containing protein [candidate division KSB1 bacterium]
MNLSNFKILLILIVTVTLSLPEGLAQQITINRIEQMPNLPQPYEMRNWKQVASGYDSLVFDFSLTGQYLPLIFWNPNPVNYPEHSSFGLHTVVGPSPERLFDAEAINVLPAVISASLVGIDKSNQNGINWVLMCEEFFNKRPDENVYLNHPIASSGDDWWYETMPNVFFYQLYDLYPNTGDFDYQFTRVADRWLEAVVAMGGSVTPWRVPNMNHRAWALSTMTPNDSDVLEPEAAGAIAWLLYNAYVETGNPNYRIGAEWCMEFLTSRSVNPSYELQLPYGVYIAARMNAELGTIYNMQKLVNWCFDVGPLRQWGVIVGNWGGYDCSGLVGEANSDGYAFTMNTFEQVGALVPMVRYDDRFARAIGKWVLNAANAARLFYPNYLPDKNQDSEEWAHQFDPNSYIAHEALRKSWLGYSPYATGDAIRDGWGKTNLALYGSSHVGIFGGIIDTSNVPMILKLDVLKTNYFQAPAYPTYLYFNPYSEEKSVELDVGSGLHDLYDVVSNTFLQTSVTGKTWFTIPADAAVLVVMTPAGGTITYDLDKMLINGVVVDYQSGQPVANYPPRIKSLAADSTRVVFKQTVKLYCTVTDRDNFTLSFTWSATGGMISGSGKEVTWTAPDSAGIYFIKCLVDDREGGQDSATVSIEVVEFINHAPTILRLKANPKKIDLGATSLITCIASDPDGDTLSYTWTAKYGTLSSWDSTVTWTAPMNQGYYYLACFVSDGRGGSAVDSIGIVVQDFSDVQTGIPIAYYPFNGNANDESGFHHHGTVYGATLVEDRWGNANCAYYFDGVNDFIRVPNHPRLNFQDEISISFWMKIEEFYNREQYPLSHGSWENRWKLSLIPEKRIRWTVKTDRGIKDLDSGTQLVTDTYYHITALYNGSDFEIYLNGILDSHSSWSGLILKTSIDLTLGQVLPYNPNYNFKGVLDEVRIYDYALSLQEIQNIYHQRTSVDDSPVAQIPRHHRLHQNHPNPFNTRTLIRYQLKEAGYVRINIYDLLGQTVRTLVDVEKTTGDHTVWWDGRNEQGQYVASGIYLYEMKIGDFKETRKLVLLK